MTTWTDIKIGNIPFSTTFQSDIINSISTPSQLIIHKNSVTMPRNMIKLSFLAMTVLFGLMLFAFMKSKHYCSATKFISFQFTSYICHINTQVVFAFRSNRNQTLTLLLLVAAQQRLIHSLLCQFHSHQTKDKWNISIASAFCKMQTG